MPNLPTESRMTELGLEPFLPVHGEQWHEVQARDEALVAKLGRTVHEVRRFYSNDTGLYAATPELAGLMQQCYDADGLLRLEEYLAEQETLRIPVVDGYSVRVDGVECDVWLVPATEGGADGANHGDMSSMLYLRDQVQAASALIELFMADSKRYSKVGNVGRQLLLSALHLVSTESQLARFGHVIEVGPAAGQADWPQISLYFDDLEGTKPNGWRNKQDTVQMLAYLTLDALERGFLDIKDLSEGHKQFLRSMVPMLESVGFPRYENSGSWEEVEAVRTSVMAIETALLHRMQRLHVTDGRFSFLADARDFDERLEGLLDAGLRELGKRLPFESPDYEQGFIKYREVDAALVYVLRYDVPQLLAEHAIPMAAHADEPMTAEAIEDMLLAQLSTLADPDTHGMIRYEQDSYQRVDFHTDSVQMIVNAIKNKLKHESKQHGTELDLDQKQMLRNQLTPPGPQATWTHPLGQVASWAARRSLDAADATKRVRYQELSMRFLNMMLTTITGAAQQNLALDATGRYEMRQVPPFVLPECFVAYTLPDGATFRAPSPHTPLNWSTAMLKEAVGLLGVELRR